MIEENLKCPTMLNYKTSTDVSGCLIVFGDEKRQVIIIRLLETVGYVSLQVRPLMDATQRPRPRNQRNHQTTKLPYHSTKDDETE